jgi:hypothetical protein
MIRTIIVQYNPNKYRLYDTIDINDNLYEYLEEW